MEIDYILYDRIVGKTLEGMMLNSSHDNKIILKDFDSNNPYHLYVFEIANILCVIDNKKSVNLEMNLLKYLIFKFRYRKYSTKIRKFRNKKYLIDKPIEPMSYIIQITEMFNVDYHVILDVYNEYYRRDIERR